MTKLEEFWQQFETRHLPAQVPSVPRYAMTMAYHQGAFDMLNAVNLMKASTPDEARRYLEGLELYCRGVLSQKRGAVQ